MFVAITGIPDFQLSVNVCENVSGHVDKIAINEGLISAITLLKSPLYTFHIPYLFKFGIAVL